MKFDGNGVQYDEGAVRWEPAVGIVLRAEAGGVAQYNPAQHRAPELSGVCGKVTCYTRPTERERINGTSGQNEPHRKCSSFL